jgi:hypothetical protein
MIVGLFLLLASSSLSRAQPAEIAIPSGTWVETDVGWLRPPAELDYLHEHYGEAGILFFGADHRFLLVYGTVIKQPGSESFSHGDGRVVFLGTWQVHGSSLRVHYQLVERTVARGGEQIPGPMLSADILMKGADLMFDRKRFDRDARLDHDLKAILEGSTARHSKSSRP